MKTGASFLIGFATVSVCLAQSVNISGKVTDASGTNPLSGAAVRLEKSGQTATTGIDGKFTLSGVAVIDRIKAIQPVTASPTVHNGVLSMSVAEKSAVEIALFDLNGKTLSTTRRIMSAGTHSVALPAHTGAGVYFYKVTSGSGEIVIRSNSVGGVSQGTGVSVQSVSSFTAFSKQARVATAIKDAIAVTKAGYLNYRVIVTNSDTNGIEIKMIAGAGTVTDADGNVYQTVKIGNQTWSTENLRTKKYTDNTPISPCTDAASWGGTATEKFCFYNNTANTDSIRKFGALYNWYVVNTKKLAPAGWHVATHAEWDTLLNYLIANGYNFNGMTTGNAVAKSLAAQADWAADLSAGAVGNDVRSNNKSGFFAYPGGCRMVNGGFTDLGQTGYWWSSMESSASNACARVLGYNHSSFGYSCDSKSFGFSVRLLKD